MCLNFFKEALEIISTNPQGKAVTHFVKYNQVFSFQQGTFRNTKIVHTGSKK